MSHHPDLFAGAVLEDETVQGIAEARRAREEELRREIRRRMRSERRAWLERMQAELALVYGHRVISWHPAEAYVTADDARALMRTYPHRFALPGGATTNTLGALFSGRDWEPLDVDEQGRSIAMHVSTTDGSHGNRLVRWRYVGRRAA